MILFDNLKIHLPKSVYDHDYILWKWIYYRVCDTGLDRNDHQLSRFISNLRQISMKFGKPHVSDVFSIVNIFYSRWNSISYLVFCLTLLLWPKGLFLKCTDQFRKKKAVSVRFSAQSKKNVFLWIKPYTEDVSDRMEIIRTIDPVILLIKWGEYEPIVYSWLRCCQYSLLSRTDEVSYTDYNLKIPFYICTRKPIHAFKE